MTAPDTPEVGVERIEELKMAVVAEEQDNHPLGVFVVEDLLAILTDYAALKTEVERLRKVNEDWAHQTCYPSSAPKWKARAEKAEAEVKRLKDQLRLANIDNFNAEAELRDLRAFKERWEKVAEAVEGADIEHIKMDEHWTELTFTPCQDVGVILRAALAARNK